MRWQRRVKNELYLPVHALSSPPEIPDATKVGCCVCHDPLHAYRAVVAQIVANKAAPTQQPNAHNTKIALHPHGAIPLPCGHGCHESEMVSTCMSVHVMRLVRQR